ncbi:MAG: amidase [Chloroflexota bacterium]|nr:amidase [Chloroflexota bacterium]
MLDRPIADLAARLRRGEVSPVELARASLERIEHDAALGAYVTVTRETALEAARTAESELRSGSDRGPLHGLPVAVKDNVDTAGIATTGGSAALRGRVPAVDAAAWARWHAGGAVLVGKTSLHELAYRAPHPDLPMARNPHDPSRTPGGSSSGSAVAVAAGHVVAALGTDTGGSVRVPAALCGVVGVKPSRDVISRDGVIPLSRSLDAVGLLARDAGDALAALGALAAVPPAAMSALHVAVVSDTPSCAPCVREALARAADAVAGAGHAVAPRAMPALDAWRRVHRRIIGHEAYAEHAGRLDRTGPLFRQAVLAGGAITDIDYAAALRERSALRAEDLLGDADALLLPTTSDVAPPLDPATGRAAGDVDLTRWTFVANVFDLPAISVPAGEHAGLPVAVQIVGRRGGEATLLALAAVVERTARAAVPA